MLLEDDRIKYSTGTSVDDDMIAEMEKDNKNYYQEVQEGKHDKELREALRNELKKGNKKGYNVFEESLKRYNSGDKLAKANIDRARIIMKEEQDRDIRLLNPDEQDFLQQIDIYVDDPSERVQQYKGGKTMNMLDDDKQRMGYSAGEVVVVVDPKQEEKVRTPKAEGGSLLADDMMVVEEEQETHIMPDGTEMPGAEHEETMESDSEMEEGYLDFIIGEALSPEEEEMLMSKMEQDEELSMLFDKVIDVAQEFAGNGPVEGPGTGVSDSIPARLSDGEFVFTAKAVEEIGEDTLMSMMNEAEAAVDERQGLKEGGNVEDNNMNVKTDALLGMDMSSNPTQEAINENMIKYQPYVRS